MTVWLAALLVVSSVVALTGLRPTDEERATLPFTVLMLGSGLGVLLGPERIAKLAFLGVLATVGLLVVRAAPNSSRRARWDILTAGLGVLGAAGALVLPPGADAMALGIACAVLFPLVPFHSAYVSALTRLPGALAAFLAVLLPIVGFHELSGVLGAIPEGLARYVEILAVAGLVVGSLGSLTRSRASEAVTFGGLASLSTLWWLLMSQRTTSPAFVVFLSAIALVTSGLLLAWGMLRARYGGIALGALGGVARGMPKFAVLLSLLALAAAGFPPFGVFSGFLHLLLGPGAVSPFAATCVIGTWLVASWYGFGLTRRVLFDRPQPGRRLEDLRNPEIASLTVVLGLLVVLGVVR